MNTTFIKDINKLIEDNRNAYTDNYYRMISDYNREKETTKEYDGRQILELIQNADDAGSDTIFIKLDKVTNSLKVSNKGNAPFSIDGIRSLMISNLSTKVKKKYIGNKGLGFRAILNWAENIQIISNKTRLEFSPQIAKEEFISLFKDKKRREEILIERNLEQDAIPFPVLAIPRICTKSVVNSQWTTEIIIKYKRNYQKDIIEQLQNLRTEILLFLKSIDTIFIEGLGKEISIQRDKNQYPIIKINDLKWKIYEEEKELPRKYQDKEKKENEFYNIKIAIKDDLSDNAGIIFNYFPTRVDIDFPIVIHGTFELDSSRNQLNKSEKNKYVLGKLIELIVKTAKEHFKKEVDYKPIKLLSYNRENTVLKELDFYNSIDSKKDTLPIYPCVDNKYRRKQDVVFYGNAFSEFVLSNGFSSWFPELIKPIPDDIDLYPSDFEKLDEALFINKIDLLSEHIKNVDIRVELIYILAKLYRESSENPTFALLTNRWHKLIKKEIVVYTPKTRNEDTIKLPQFIKLDFLNRDLYETLLQRFGLSGSYEKSRDLQRSLKSIVNLQPYEPVSVIRKIATGTRAEIKRNPKNRNELTISMVQSLFQIWKNIRDESTKFPEDLKLKIITKHGSLANINDCFLSKNYPSGSLTEDLFVGIYKKNQFIADRKIFRLQNEDELLVERFLLWIGINKHTKFVELENPSAYRNFVLDTLGRPINYRNSEIRVTGIEDFDKLTSSLSREKIILWILKDSVIKRQLDDSENNDIFRYSKNGEYHDRYPHTIYTKPSYIIYQFISSGIFKDFIIGYNNIPVLNSFEIDYKSSLFNKYNIEKREAESILLKIGAIESFNKLSIERVFEILNTLPIKDEKGNYSQRIYKLAMEHYKNNSEPLPDEELLLFAKKGQEGMYEINSNVYYSDNITLPRKLIANKAMLNLPGRLGERQISTFFKINTFENLKPKIASPYKLNYQLGEVFNIYFNQIKPYILTYRLNRLDKEKLKNKEEEAKAINNISIKLYFECGYEINGKVDKLEVNDFINDNEGFHIKTGEYNSLKDLKADSGFCDAFVEILSIALKVSDQRNEFRFTFKNDLKDTEHSVINEFGIEILDEARKLLGLSDYEKRFWGIIFQIKNHDIGRINSLKSIAALGKRILKTDLTPYIKKIDYKDLSNKSNIPYFIKLFKKLEIAFEEFNKLSDASINFYAYHKDQLLNRILDFEGTFKNQLWHQLNVNKNKQVYFLDNVFSFTKDFTGFIDEQLIEYQMKLECPYNLFFEKYILRKYNIKINKKLKLIDYDNILKHNIKSIGCDVDDLNNQLKSLLCFEGNNNKVAKAIHKDIEQDGNEKDNDVPEPNDNNSIMQPGSLKRPELSPKSFKSNGKRGGTYNQKRDERNQVKGGNAERKVYKLLVSLYGEKNVIWISKYAGKSDSDDTAGYDIRYKNNNGIWKFVEVKSIMSNYFFLSKGEKMFGLANKENYELALVHNINIHFIYDFFQFDNENETFENNSKYIVDENEYIIQFELNN